MFVYVFLTWEEIVLFLINSENLMIFKYIILLNKIVSLIVCLFLKNKTKHIFSGFEFKKT